jgi:signal transduction histidine kinase
VFALRRLAGLYDAKAMQLQASATRDELIAIGRKDKDEEIQVGVNIVMGEYYFNSGMFEKALESYLAYIKYLKIDYAKTRNSASRSNIGVGYLAVGEIYQKLGRPAESLGYFKESIGYLDTYREGLETAYKDLVTSYLSLIDLNAAHQFYDALKRSVDISNNKTLLVDAQVEMGKAFLGSNDLESARMMLAEAERNAVLTGEKEDLYSVKIALGDLYLMEGSNNRAINYYEEALPLAIYFKNKAAIAQLYYNLAQAEKRSDATEKAYDHILLYAIYTDSLKKESISKNIIEMEARFQNEAKQQKIALLNKENINKNLQLEQERRTRWLLTIAVILSLLTLILIYFIYRNKNKLSQVLDKKNKELDLVNTQLTLANQGKARLFSIISHDLRSPVSQLFSFLKLQQTDPDIISEEDKAKHQQRLIQSSADLLDTMEDLLLWSKSQMDHFAMDVEEIDVHAMFDDVNALMRSQAEPKHISIGLQNVACTVIHTDYNLLLIILRNLLQNAINHSFRGSTISLSSGFCDTGKPFLRVTNQGEVIPEDKIAELLNSVSVNSKSSGYGLLIVKELLRQVNASLSITSTEKGGTVMTVTLPISA